ncbi:dyslexia-associated protein KIAA0319-like protein [Dysidea avara]|uniref:dyslexia-associated protein KIAA0319-like protein n=1 Tax=Dysidea avara TaxID=196820 RepID=UPI0033324E8E
MTLRILLSLLFLLCIGSVRGSDQCSVAHYHTHSYPLGKTHVEGLRILSGNVSFNECLSLCCNEGPSQCGYLWLFGTRCVALPCITNKTACSPHTLMSLPSVLVEIKYDKDHVTPEPTGTMQPTSPNDEYNPAFEDLADELAGSSSFLSTTDIIPSSVIFITSSSSSSLAPLASVVVVKDTSYTETPAVTPSPQATSYTSNVPVPPTPSHASSITVATDALDGNKDITLPVTSVKIFASTWPKLRNGIQYSWQWSRVFGPNKGAISGETSKEASLTDLVEGVYGLKVSVTGSDGSYGDTFVNVTVHPAPRVNKPPHAIITPSNHVLLHLPTSSTILDGSSSTDDYKAEKMTYKWEEVSGPLETHLPSSTDPVLTLRGLVAGTYILKLTVTDVDGVSHSTTANITVVPSVDNPPVAKAGGAQVLVWPNNHITLYGNASFDDNGIVSYNWQKTVGPSVDILGSTNPIVQLKNLQKGEYVFTLTVADASGQHSATEVSVAVLEEANKPPVANAGKDKAISWPSDSVLLDGSGSSDNQRIIKYCWELVKPMPDNSGVVITDAHSVKTNVTQLHIQGKSPTVYQFNLTVTDEHNLTSSDVVLVTVTKDAAVPPSIVMESLVKVSLPQHLVVLNASQSHDDFGIVSYEWSPHPQNLAIGEMLPGSDRSAVLYFTNFVEGVYLFNLTVHNKYNVHSTTIVNLTVLPDVHEENLVQLFLSDDYVDLTFHKLNLLREMISNEIGPDSKVIIQETRQLLSKNVIEFYVVKGSTGVAYRASYVIKQLDQSSVFKKLNDEFAISGMETKVCQTNCSGHGHCDYHSKTCMCDVGWMANPFRRVDGKKGLNCDWSVLYFVLILLAPVVLVAILIWCICCCCYKRKKRVVSNRRVRYALLPGDNDNKKYNMNSIMVTESETEEEILFDTKSKKKTKNSNLTKYGPNAQLINPAKLQ